MQLWKKENLKMGSYIILHGRDYSHLSVLELTVFHIVKHLRIGCGFCPNGWFGSVYPFFLFSLVKHKNIAESN